LEPSFKVGSQLFYNLREAVPTRSLCHFPDPLLEPLAGFLADEDRSVASNAETEKGAFPWFGHGALGLVDFQLQLRFEKPRDSPDA